MLVLNVMMRQRLKRSTKKICTAFFRTLHNEKLMDGVAVHSSNTRTTTDRSYRSYQGSKFLLQPVASAGVRNCLPGYLQHRRFYSTEPSQSLPLLTDLPKLTPATPFRGLKLMLINILAIRPQLDPEFSLKEFINTTDKVVQIVSNRLANCDYDALQEMVTPHVFDQIKNNLPNFTESQRQKLAVEIDDVAVSYADDIKIDEGNNGEKHLQITTVHHVLQGAGDIRKMFSNFSPFSMMQQQQGAVNPIEELKRRKGTSLDGFVTNFSFLRTYNTETSTASDWVINGLNFYAKKLEF